MNCFGPWRWSNTNFIWFRLDTKAWKLNLISFAVNAPRKMYQAKSQFVVAEKQTKKTAKRNENKKRDQVQVDICSTKGHMYLTFGVQMNDYLFWNGKWVHREICRTCKVINYSETNEKQSLSWFKQFKGKRSKLWKFKKMPKKLHFSKSFDDNARMYSLNLQSLN